MQKKHPGESQDHFEERVTDYIANLDQQVQMNIGRIDNLKDINLKVESTKGSLVVWNHNNPALGTRDLVIDTGVIDSDMDVLRRDIDDLIATTNGQANQIRELEKVNKLLLKYIKESL